MLPDLSHVIFSTSSAISLPLNPLSRYLALFFREFTRCWLMPLNSTISLSVIPSCISLFTNTTLAVTHLSARHIASCSKVNPLACKVASTTLLYNSSSLFIFRLLISKTKRQGIPSRHTLPNSTNNLLTYVCCICLDNI